VSRTEQTELNEKMPSFLSVNTQFCASLNSRRLRTVAASKFLWTQRSASRSIAIIRRFKGSRAALPRREP
jgi:hypothetical protein